MVGIGRSVPFSLNADWAIFTGAVGSIYGLGLRALTSRFLSARASRRIRRM
jgi:hypothetical protein